LAHVEHQNLTELNSNYDHLVWSQSYHVWLATYDSTWLGQIASDHFFGQNAYAIYFVHNHLWLIRKNGHRRPSMMLNWWPSIFSRNRVINWTQWPSSDQCEGSLVGIFLVVERDLWAGMFQQRAVGEEIFSNRINIIIRSYLTTYIGDQATGRGSKVPKLLTPMITY
jgi:hypothetical protein